MVNIKNKKIPCRVLYKKRGALARRKNTLKRKKTNTGFCRVFVYPSLLSYLNQSNHWVSGLLAEPV